MIKALIITHGELGMEMVKVCDAILESKSGITCITFDWREDGSHIIAEIERFVSQHADHEIIIFTDMFGGSPANISTKFFGPRVEVVSGINLPGLLKFLCYKDRGLTLPEITRIVKEGAIQGINVMSEYLGEKKP